MLYSEIEQIYSGKNIFRSTHF